MKATVAMSDTTDVRTTEELAVAHLDLARSIARRFARRCPHLADDFEGAAMLGLWDAARKFRGHRGVKFKTYATWRVTGAVRDFARRHSGLRRASGYPPPTPAQWSALPEEVRRASEPEYTRVPYGSDADAVWELTQGLSRREREVVAAYFGGSSQARIADRLGVHPARVSQLVAAAVDYLRYKFAPPAGAWEEVMPKTTEAAAAATRGKPRPPAKPRTRPREFLSVGEVVKACGCASHRVVVGWCDKGLLPCVRLPGGGDRRVRRTDLAAFMRRHGMGPEADRLENGGGP